MRFPDCNVPSCSAAGQKSLPQFARTLPLSSSGIVGSKINMVALPWSCFRALVAPGIFSSIQFHCLARNISFTNRGKLEVLVQASFDSSNSQLHQRQSVSATYSISPDRRISGANDDLATPILPTPKMCMQRLHRHVKLRAAASDPNFPLEDNVEFSEQGTSARFPVDSFFASERMKVVLMVAFAMALCNIDRVVMSVAIVRLSSLLNWSTSFAGLVQSSFLWGYMLSPIIGGTLVDQYGGKTVMAYGVGLWSLATCLTPWAAHHSAVMLFAVRILMGFGEGVAMPCMSKMVSRWFPRFERSKAIGLSMVGFHLGSASGLMVTPVIMAKFGVHMPFIAFGLLGFAWLLFWASFIHKDPQSHPNIGKSELQYIQQENNIFTAADVGTSTNLRRELPPFGLLLKKLPAWAIIVANSMNNWGYFILLSWMPVYFNMVYGVDLKQAAWYSGLPWAIMAGLGIIAGIYSDFLIASGLSVTTVRKIMQSIGFLGPGFALLGVSASSSASVAAVWLTVAVGLSAFSQAGFLVNFQEIAPRYAGVLHGIANTAGTMAGIFSTIGIGVFVQRLGSFQAFLTLTATLYIISTLFWDIFASGEQIID